MNPAMLAELRADGVNVANNADLDAILAALQARVIRLVTGAPEAFDRDRYTRLMALWQELSAEREGEGT
jgi:hypothetical protein